MPRLMTVGSVLIGLVIAHSVDAQSQAKPSSRPVAPVVPMQVSTGTAAVASELAVLRLGNVPTGDRRTVALTISRQAGQADTDIRVYCEGPNVTCSWRGDNRSDRARRVSASPVVELTFAVPQAPAYNYLVVTDGRMRTTNFVVLDYTLFAKRTLEVVYSTPGYVSGIGEDWGPWYPVCSGTPVEGYRLSQTAPSFAVSREETGGCGAWVNCEATAAPASQVCYRFQVQGKEHQFAENPHETKTGAATLKVFWDLLESDAALEAVKSTEGKPSGGG